MQFFGDNTRFGEQRIEITPDRFADPAVCDDEEFPFGTNRLVPVLTSRRKKGGFKCVYAFPFAEGEASSDDLLAQELCAAIGFVNTLLAEAAELSGYGFGAIGAVWLGVTEQGYSFTRVEKTAADDDWASPIHLRIETSDVPNQPDTLSASIDYDVDGHVRHVLITEYGEARQTCRVTAAIEFGSGDIVVQRVTLTRDDGTSEELYGAW